MFPDHGKLEAPDGFSRDRPSNRKASQFRTVDPCDRAGVNLRLEGSEISLNYADDSVEYGSFLASFQGLGDNYAPGSEPSAIDGNLATHTTMGNNVDEPGKRLRVTLGFMSSLMPG